jgi:hypothetical protein
MRRKLLIILIIVIFILSVSVSGCSSFSWNPFDWGNDQNGKDLSPSKGRPSIQQYSPKPTKAQ